jgi:signal peptidase I
MTSDDERPSASLTDPGDTAVPDAIDATDATGAASEAATSRISRRAAKRAAKRRSALRSVIDWVVVLAVATTIALVVRAYVVQTYYIPSLSMYPTLEKGDRILVLKAAYRFTSPATGDVIVFRAPPAERSMCDSPEVDDLVKRIIGTPGDTIWSVGDKIYRNGTVLNQSWMHVNPLGEAIKKQTVPPNDYFVMGDNHPESCDSRVWGYVPRGNIIGKAVLIFWPIARFSII